MSFSDYFNEHIPSVESFHPHFDEALGWILKAGGKHFRAQLMLSCAGELGMKNIHEAYPVALGIELIHAYSLIHDDLPVMDNADLRRGVESVHKKFGQTTAILVGDGLNTHAFYEISRCELSYKKRCKIIEILAKNAGIKGMIIGQAIDCEFEGKNLNEKKLRFLHEHKTGALIAACIQIAAILAERKHKKEYHDLGLDLGLAFQINDDIIDATASEQDAGKPVAHDIAKNSFVNLLGLEGARNELKSLREKIIKKAAKLGVGVSIAELMQTYIKG